MLKEKIVVSSVNKSKTFIMARKIILTIALIVLTAPFSYAGEKDDFELAVKSFSSFHYDEATILFNNFIDEYPYSSDLNLASFYIGKSFYLQGEYDKSFEILNKLLIEDEAYRFLDELYLWLAKINFSENEHNKALLNINSLIVEYPYSDFLWDAKYLSALVYIKINRNNRAEDVLKEIIGSLAGNSIVEEVYLELLNLYNDTNDFSKLDALVKYYLEANPEGASKVNMYMFEAKSYYRKSRYDEAIKKYSKALEFAEQSKLKDLIYQERGAAYLAKNLNIQALADFDKITKKELREFSYAIYSFSKREFAKSLEMFDGFLSKYPNSQKRVIVYFNRAECLYELGRIKDALYSYREIVKDFNDLSNKDIIDKANYGMAWCYLKSGEFMKAVQGFKDTIEYTDNPVVKISSQIQIADTYHQDGKAKEALLLYNQILDDYPDNSYSDYINLQRAIIFLKQERFKEARVILSKLRKAKPFSTFSGHVQYYLGLLKFSQNKYAQAESFLREFIDKYQEHSLMPKVYYLYSKCLIEQGKNEESLKKLNFIIDNFSDLKILELAYVDIADIHYSLSQYKVSEKFWKDFLAKFKNSLYVPNAHFYLSKIYQYQDKQKQAISHLTVIVKVYSDSFFADAAKISLGNIFFASGDLDQAEVYLSSVSTKDKSIAQEAKFYLAMVLTEKGEFDRSLPLYDYCIELGGKIAELAVVEKASLFKNNKEYVRAVEVLEIAFKNKPDESSFVFDIGFCFERLNRFDEAIEKYYKIVYDFKNINDIIKAYFRIARVYEKTNRYDEAKEAYKKIIAYKSPEAEVAKKRLRELE